MSTLQDSFKQRVESVIEELNIGDAKSLSITSPLIGKRFIPDFVISKESNPLLIIEEKKTMVLPQFS